MVLQRARLFPWLGDGRSDLLMQEVRFIRAHVVKAAHPG